MSTQSQETRIKRLLYRSWHRGCKETDLILGHFCEAFVHDMDEQAITTMEALLDEDDVHIWDWMIGKATPTKAEYEPILKKLRDFREYTPL